MRLGRIGFDHVVGYLAPGLESLDARPDLIGSVARVTAQSLAEWMRRADAPLIVDVRTEKETHEKQIEGSVNFPLNHLLEHLDQLPNDRTIVVHCRSGYRSAVAASLLQRAGLTNVYDLVGGIDAWEASRLPVREGAVAAQ